VKTTRWRLGRFWAIASLALLLAAPGFCFGGEFPSFPWETWGNVTEYVAKDGGSSDETDEDDEFRFNVHLDQGINWFQIGSRGPIFYTSLGVDSTWSDLEEKWWDRNLNPAISAGFQFPLSSGSTTFTVRLGVKYEIIRYYGDEQPYDEQSRVGIFVSMYAGGDWRK